MFNKLIRTEKGKIDMAGLKKLNNVNPVLHGDYVDMVCEEDQAICHHLA
jgi:hypothetical protein